MKAIQEEFGEQVQILDNHSRAIPKIDLLRWTDIQHQQRFSVHKASSKPNPTSHDNQSESNNGRYHSPSDGKACFIIHRIRSSIPLKAMKAVPRIMQLLVDNACYMNMHKWTEDVWDITQIGFMSGLDPQFYTAEQATSKVSQKIHQFMPKAKIPPFRLVYCSPQLRTKEYYLNTKAYAIEAEKTHSTTLSDIMMKVFRETREFVPFRMKSKNPKAFANVIKHQTLTIANHHTIILQNIGVDAMYYISDYIMTVDGVIDIMPARTVDINGNYRVLVHKDNFRMVRKTLMHAIPDWYEVHVKPDAYPREGAFPGPPCVAPIADDGYSSGEESYMNLSINTALSYDCSMLSDGESYSRSEQSSRQQSHPPAGIPHKVKTSNAFSWASRLSTSIHSTADEKTNHEPQSANKSSPPYSDVTSEIASNKAEVEAMQNQLTELTATFESEKQALRATFEKEKQDLVVTMREEMALTLKEQLSQFMIHLQPSAAHPPPPQQDTSVREQLKEIMEIQDQRYMELTRMVASLMSAPSNTATAKRSCDQIFQAEAQTPIRALSDKRQNSLATPQKQTPHSQAAIDVNDTSPSNVTGHTDMDLSDDSSTHGSNPARSLKFNEGDNTNKKHD